MTQPMNHIDVGAAGELLAAAHLGRDGMTILDRNWRCFLGEIDIIAGDGRCIVFCEVKTRRTLRFGSPFNAITPAKTQRIRQLAQQWTLCGNLHQRRHVKQRFDVISVVLTNNHSTAAIRHIKGAF